MSIFEQITRKHLRFDTPIGQLSVDDLWELPLSQSGSRRLLTCLNDIAVGLHKQIQEDTVSFVDPATKVHDDLQLRFDVVKHIIDVRKAEQIVALEARDKAARKQKLLGILARKEEADLEGLSKEDLRSMIDAL